MTDCIVLAEGLSFFGISEVFKDRYKHFYINDYAANDGYLKYKKELCRVDKLIIIDYQEPWYYKSFIEKIINYRNSNNKITKIIFDRSFEDGISEETIIKKKEYYNSVKIADNNFLFFVNKSSSKYPQYKDINFYFIDCFAVSSYNTCLINGHPISKISVGDRPNRLNILIGSIKKMPRPWVIESLYNAGLLKQSLLSLLSNEEEISEIFKENQDLIDLLKNNIGPIDGVNCFSNNNGGSTSNGWSGNCFVYDNSSISFVVETWVNSSVFLTEKIYRSIINKHPFVVLGSSGTLKFLKDNGFQTFSEIIDESYDSVEIEENWLNKKINKTSESAGDFLKKIPENSAKIQEIVDHNYKTLCSYAEQEHQAAITFIEDFLNTG